MRKLGPENDPRGGKVAPDRPRGFHSGKLGHLNVENTNRGFVLQRQHDRVFSVTGFKNRLVRRKITLEYFAQVIALGDIVFGD